MTEWVEWLDIADTEFIDTQDTEFVDAAGSATAPGWNEFVLEDGAEAIACEDGGALLTEEIAAAAAAVDYVAFAMLGWYSETYGSAELQYLCNLYASWGMIEDAQNVTTNITEKMMYYLQQMEVISG